MKQTVSLGIFFALVGAFLFSAKGVLVKWTIPFGVDAVDALALRMLFAVPCYVALMIWAKKRVNSVPLKKQHYGKLFFLGFIGYYLSSMLDFHGLQYVSAGLERMIIFLYPSFVVLLSILFKKEILEKKTLLALLFSYVGIACVYLGDADFSRENGLLGASMILASAFVFAVFLIIGGELIREIGTVAFTNHAMVIAGAMVLVHFFALGRSFDFAPKIFVAGAILGVFGTVIPSYCMNYGISILGTSRASILSTMGPISTLILGYLVLGESVGVLEMLGICMVVFSSFFLKKAK